MGYALRCILTSTKPELCVKMRSLSNETPWFSPFFTQLFVPQASQTALTAKCLQNGDYLLWKRSPVLQSIIFS